MIEWPVFHRGELVKTEGCANYLPHPTHHHGRITMIPFIVAQKQFHLLCHMSDENVFLFGSTAAQQILTASANSTGVQDVLRPRSRHCGPQTTTRDPGRHLPARLPAFTHAHTRPSHWQQWLEWHQPALRRLSIQPASWSRSIGPYSLLAQPSSSPSLLLLLRVGNTVERRTYWERAAVAIGDRESGMILLLLLMLLLTT